MASSAKKTNRLALEKSPYLLQHATNPVDWYICAVFPQTMLESGVIISFRYPWGQEAFEEAKKQDKLIFLSVGYSTCHWCHVMEHESFENEEIAKIMNENFINVKVDREERPDVDKVYMTFVQVMLKINIKTVCHLFFLLGKFRKRWLANECVFDSGLDPGSRGHLLSTKKHSIWPARICHHYEQPY
jgi:hypothetical protein